MKSIAPLIAFMVMALVGAWTWRYMFPPPPDPPDINLKTLYTRLTPGIHGPLQCDACHDDSLIGKIQSPDLPPLPLADHRRKLRLTHAQVLAMVEKCAACHRAQFLDWQSAGHSVRYKKIFLDGKQNMAEQLNADCLRCHGMFFPGPIDELVAPINTAGPWRLLQPELADQPSIVCMSCHQMHREPSADSSPTTRPGSPLSRLSLYSRREQTHFSADQLPAPAMWQGDRPVKIAPDPRLRLCVQCHAPNAFHQIGSSDDHTPTGVHEGLSCMECHRPHSNDPRASCVNCHPRLSNCGLEVAGMDTTFKSSSSPHNIHRVACGDCHAGRRPEKPVKK